MIYVMSDLHGCETKYKKMLAQIAFGEGDTLYLLGDVIDRGWGGIAILQDMMARKNVIPLSGNHEALALPCLRALLGEDRSLSQPFGARFPHWSANGGEPTAAMFRRLAPQTQRAVVEYLESFGLTQTVTVGGRDFHLSHSLPFCLPPGGVSAAAEHDLLWDRPDYGTAYDPETYFVTGHTPTFLIDPAYRGRIWRGNYHIAVDCGAVFGESLGCICLDMMREYYVE